MRELDKEPPVSHVTEIPLESLEVAASALAGSPYARPGTPQSIDTYRQRIAEKIGRTHRTEYVKAALTAGLRAGDHGQEEHNGRGWK